jgi:hypothetical protein
MKKNMIFKSVQTYSILINGNLATIDVVERETNFFFCLFNIEKHKDFINGFGTLGFVVVITYLGTQEDLFYPIPISTKPALTNEHMVTIWNQIKEKQLESNKEL